MASRVRENFTEKVVKISSLHLDVKNPRLPEGQKIKEQDDLVDYIARWYEPIVIARSIAAHGYFYSEPVIAVKEGRQLVVVEGNRRLAALKLLNSDALRARVDLDDEDEWDELATSKRIPTEVPVVIAKDRNEVAPIIGYRHISGIEPWDPWAKARFIASLVEDQDVSFTEVARIVGEKEADIRAHYRNFRVVVAARDAKIPTDKVESNFGVFTRAMTSGGIREYIGAPMPSSVRRLERVVSKDVRALKELLSWLFGEGKNGPVLSESRQITDLGTVLSSEEGVKVLRQTRDIEEAMAASGGLRARLVKRLASAFQNLTRAQEDILDYQDDDEVVDLLEQCRGALNELTGEE